VLGTESSNEALHRFPHVTRVADGRSSGWLPRHESGLLVGFDIRAALSDSHCRGSRCSVSSRLRSIWGIHYHRGGGRERCLGLAFGVSEEIVGSSLHLLVNLSGMALAGWPAPAVQQAIWSRVSPHRA
jgi:hypothetical protein